MAEIDRTQETLFVALTRPAMKFGVPFEGYIANLFGSIGFAIAMGRFPYMFVGLVIHWVMREMTARDHNIFRVYKLWLATKGRATGDGSPLSSLPWRLVRFEDMGSSV